MAHRILVVDDSSTLRKVVHTILSKNGYECVATADGQEALQLLEQETVDLVLLDFVMPRMNGYQFCRELRARKEVRDLPVVLMSAKAERIRDQFLRQTGAVDAITKPFEPKALVAVIESAMRKSEEGRAPKVPNLEDMPDPESLGSLSDSLPPSSLFPQGSSTRTELAQVLTECLGPELIRAFPDATLLPERLHEACSYALEGDRLAALLQRLRWHLDPNTDEVLQGDIEAIPIGEIMQVMQMQHQTGMLEMTNRKMTVFIHLRDGLVDLAQCREGDPKLLLGRYFLEDGLLSVEKLDLALKEASTKNERIGTHLLNHGLITRQNLETALKRQSQEIIYDALRWQKGWFLLRRHLRSPEAQDASLGLPIASIIMEGFRRVDEWHLVEQSVRFEQVLVRDENAINTLEDMELTTHEQQVLQDIDGNKSVREVMETSLLSSFDASKAFYRLIKARLVQPKSSNPA